MATAVQVEEQTTAPATAFEVSVGHAELVRQLSAVRQAVPSRVSIPILGNILLEAADGTLTITASDLDATVRVSMPAKIAQPGACTLPARKFYDYVKLLPDGEVKMSLQDNHWVKIRSGRSNTKMVGLPPSNFPNTPTAPAEDFGIPADKLLRLISFSGFAVSEDESRFTMAAALLIVRPDILEMVATDGHRLADVTLRTETAVFEEKRLLMPARSIALVRTLFADSSLPVFISETPQTIFVRTKGRTLITRKIAGAFPNYAAVIPKVEQPGIVTSTEAVLPAIERSMLFAHEGTHCLAMEWSKELLCIKAAAQDIGESAEEIDIFGGPDEVMKVGYNGFYLREALRLVDGAFTIYMKDGQSAALIEHATDDGFLFRYVVMPMRLG